MLRHSPTLWISPSWQAEHPRATPNPRLWVALASVVLASASPCEALAVFQAPTCPPPHALPQWEDAPHEHHFSSPRGGEKAERDAFGAFPGQFASENFIIKWGDQLALDPVDASVVAAALEVSWVEFIDVLGFPAPQGSEDWLFNVYIGNSGGNAPPIGDFAGYFTTDPSGVGMIVLAPDAAVDVDIRSQVAAHEFFHAVQYETGAYLAAPLAASWYREATADWAALEAFPDDRIVPRHLVGYAYTPHLGIDYLAPEDDETILRYRHYGAFILPLFVSEHIADPSLVAQSFLGAGPSDSPLEVLDALLREADSDLASAFGAFAAHNATWDYELGRDFEDAIEEYGALVPGADQRFAVQMEGTGTDGWVDPPVSLRPWPNGYNVIRLRRPAQGLLHVGFEALQEDGVQWWATLVRDYLDHAEYVPITQGTGGSPAEISLMVAEESAFYLAISATSQVQAPDLGLPYRFRLEVATDPEPDPLSCGCTASLTRSSTGKDQHRVEHNSRTAIAALVVVLIGALRRRSYPR